MVIDLVITKTDDGYSADVPSISGFECWAPGEDEAIEKSLELVSFYLNLPVKEIKVDRARREGNKVINKLIFQK